MTIDEPIEKHKKLKISAERNNDKRGAFYSGEEHKQITEWLEELKELRNMTAGHLYAVAFNRGYLKAEKEVRNKAIDDFAENIRLYYSLKQEMGYVATTYEDLINYILELAEQLKAGGDNVQKK